MDRLHPRRVHVENDQVGAHALLQHAAIRAPLRRRAARREHAQHLLGRHHGRVERVALLRAGQQVGALQDVVRVVRGHAVRADRQRHARVDHLLHRRETARELHVGRRVQADVHPAAREQLDVGILDPHAMRGRHTVVEDTAMLEPGGRRHAVVAPFALLVLGARLGEMQVDAAVVLAGLLGHAAHHALGRRVLAVYAHLDLHAAVAGALEALEQLGVDPGHGQGVVVLFHEAHGAAVAVVGLHAGGQRGLAAVDGRVVHVRVADDAVADHLGLREHRAPVVVLFLDVHLALERPYGLLQPVLQGLVFGIAAQQGHGRVRVRVEERAGQQLAAAVVALAIGLRVRGRLGAHVGDSRPLHPDEAVLLPVQVLVENVDVLEQHMRLSSRAHTRRDLAGNGGTPCGKPALPAAIGLRRILHRRQEGAADE